MRINKARLCTNTVQRIIKLIVACSLGPDSSLAALPLQQHSQGQQSLFYTPKDNIKISPKEKYSMTEMQHSSSFNTTTLQFVPYGYARTVMHAKHSVGPYFLQKCFPQEAKLRFCIQPRLVKFAFAKWAPISSWFFAPQREIFYSMSHFPTCTNSPPRIVSV